MEGSRPPSPPYQPKYEIGRPPLPQLSEIILFCTQIDQTKGNFEEEIRFIILPKTFLKYNRKEMVSLNKYIV